VLLVLLGAWGALAPFIGPTFTFAFTPDKAWHWTAARGWYEVAPGSAVFVGGLLLLIARSRAITVLGAWFAILGGTWFIVGPAISSEVTLGSLGQPIGSSSGQRVAEVLTFFYGLGAIILYLSASAFGRLSVVTVRDLRIAERRESDRMEAEADDRDHLDHLRYDQERFPAEHEPVRDEGANTDTQVYDQHSRDDEDSDERPGYRSALGYGQNEQSSQYSAPTYGRHDANVRGTTSSTTETQGIPTRAPTDDDGEPMPNTSTTERDDTTQEQPH
jgi:hypothetical protein